MTPRLGLWLILAAVGWGYAFWVYGRREVPVRSRRWMAGLRGGALALVLLLLLDFSLPAPGGVGGSWTLVDASPSMAVPQGDEGAAAPLTRLPGALEAPPSRTRMTFGTPGRRLSDDWRPGDPLEPNRDSRLAPTLSRALESGATRVRIFTDLRVQDPVEVEALIRESPVVVEFFDLGGELRNVGIAELDLPDTGEAGEEISGEAVLFGDVPGPVQLTLSVAGEPVADTVVSLSGSGRVRVPVRFRVPEQAGPVPVAVAARGPGDTYRADDRRTRIVEVDPGAGELVLVSWTPDWEARFLLPILQEVTGLQAEGYLRVGGDRFMSMTGPIRFRSGAEVARALEESRLGVAHAFPREPGDPWSRALNRAPRTVLVPGSEAPGGAGGEWYLSTEVPASPVAGELAGVPVLGLPPLFGLREGPEGGLPVLLVQRGGTGEAAPALVLRDTDSGRQAVALAHGFWRWAFREGAPRELYRRLWSGAAGWLLAGEGADLREVGISPGASVVAPAALVEWSAGPAAGGLLQVEFSSRDGGDPGAGAALAGEPVPVDSLGRVRIPAPSRPGVYRWRAEVREGPGQGESASGLLVAERSELDLLPPRALHLTELASASVVGGEDPAGRRPLRTHPLPYIILLVLLAVEWTVRRRSGLR